MIYIGMLMLSVDAVKQKTQISCEVAAKLGRTRINIVKGNGLLRLQALFKGERENAISL